MAKVTRVKGNRLRLAIPLQTVTVTEHGTVTADYNVPAGAEVTVTLTGTWKTYKYMPEVNGNLLTITDEGTLPAGTYAVETTVVQADGEHLRSKYCNMVEISDCNDGVTQDYDDFISGSVTLEEQIFYFAKGDKGDAFTYEDFTEEQIADLQRPATEAAAALNEAEQQRVANERARQTAESARGSHEGNRILAEETREGNEQTREMAEEERQRNTQQAIADAADATAAANTAAANAKADYVGSDNYVYRWVEATQEYVKTNLYVKGDPGTTDYNDLQNKPDLSAFVTKSVDDLLYYYLKSETYTKAEVQALVNAVKQFTYEAVPTLPAATADTMHKIYLVPSSDPQAQNVKDEFITIDKGTEAQTRYAWEQIGSTAIDLSGYVTTTALDTALADYTTTAQLTQLLAGKQDVINDLAEIRSGAALGATALQTETDPTVPTWAKQSTKPSYTPQEVGALPANTPLFDGDYNSLTNKPDLSGYITVSVNNLVNYYLKSDVYTKTEVANLIAAIQQFHYEIYASTSAVTSPVGNVLYLIGPTGIGTDRYEEYVYDSTKQEPWVKIGDTSIDLSDYYTKGQTDSAITQALNTALADYTTTAALTLLLAGKQDVINDLAEIRSGAALGATALQSETDPTVPAWAKQSNKPTYTAQEVGALPNSTKYGSTIDLAMDSATYVLTLSLKDQDGTVLNTKTVDLPIESVVVSGRYDAANKKIVLTLQSGSTIDVPVGDLIAGLQTEITSVNMLDADLVDDTISTHKFVTAQEKQAWNNKQDTLVSGTNIKTVNNQSILGAGNINIQGSYTPTLQSSPTSSTTTYTKDGQTVDFEIGQFCRVAVTGGYDFYQLRDLVTENNVTTAVWAKCDELPDNVALFAPDSGEGIVPTDGIRAETVNSGATISVNPDVVTLVDGAVGTAAITLQVPQDNLAHVWDILMTTDSTVAITFAMSNSATILCPNGFSVGASKAVEISVIGVGTKYYLRYGEFA